MGSDPFGAELIENYLRTRGVRYFRGHHDDEFFFLLNTHHGRLHIHLEVCDASGDTIRLNVAAERYFPAELRARLADLADAWNRASPSAKAVVVESSDPTLIGVAAENRYSSADPGDFAAAVDQTIQSAIELFNHTRVSAGLVPFDPADIALLDAG